MRIKYFAVALLFTACNASKTNSDAPTPVQAKEVGPIDYAKTITEEELKEHLYIYASDEFEGRETGQPGQKKAVEYLTNEYKSLSIAPGNKGSYIQKVPLEFRKVPTGTLELGTTTLTQGKQFVTMSPLSGDFKEVVYVGYGIKEGDYNSYGNMDVAGKVVLAKSGEPMNESGSFLFSGTQEPSKWSNLSEGISKRLELATELGAKALLLVDDKNFGRYQQYYRRMARNNSGSMRLKSNTESASLLVLNSEAGKAFHSAMDKDNTGQSVALSWKAMLTSNNGEVDTENVVAFIKGSEKPDEFLVISSHLDHIGVSQGEVNNGADDDGSGTVALLEIAEAFQQAVKDGNGPKRSVVFLHVTGEEKGLLGSRYYTDQEPVFPLANTVANLNIDMVGRIDPKRDGDRNYIYLIGSDKLSTELHELSEEINSKYTNIELDYTYNDENDPNRFYYRSDHYNFAKNNIPIIFYFNGTHADYHRPSDTPDKINYDLLTNRAQLVFYTAWEIANRANRLVVDKATTP